MQQKLTDTQEVVYEKCEISYKECFRILNWKEMEQCDKVKEEC